jgi:hypothetical protein
VQLVVRRLEHPVVPWRRIAVEQHRALRIAQHGCVGQRQDGLRLQAIGHLQERERDAFEFPEVVGLLQLPDVVRR